MAASPPLGAQTRSKSGWTARMALSSLDMYTRLPASPTTMERSFSRSFRAIRPPSKPTRMEKGPVSSRLEKACRRKVSRSFR